MIAEVFKSTIIVLAILAVIPVSAWLFKLVWNRFEKLFEEHSNEEEIKA